MEITYVSDFLGTVVTQPFQLCRLAVAMIAVANGRGDGFTRVPDACANGASCTRPLLVRPNSQQVVVWIRKLETPALIDLHLYFGEMGALQCKPGRYS